MAAYYETAVERHLGELHEHRNRIFDMVVGAYQNHDGRLFTYAAETLEKSSSTMQGLEKIKEGRRPDADELVDLIVQVKLTAQAVDYSDFYISNN